jgi:hypothetical protein
MLVLQLLGQHENMNHSRRLLLVAKGPAGLFIAVLFGLEQLVRQQASLARPGSQYTKFVPF